MPEWNELFRQEQFRWPDPDSRAVAFAARLRSAGACSVLDLGCGAGRHTVLLAQQGFSVAGLDNAANGLLAARTRLEAAPTTAALILADMSDLPFAGATFDAVLSLYVVHHNCLAAIRRTLDEIRRVLRPGGLALVDLNATASWRYRNERGAKVEPGTIVPTEGPEAGVPHHYVDEAGARSVFSCLQILDLYLNEQFFRDSGGVIRRHCQWTALLMA